MGNSPLVDHGICRRPNGPRLRYPQMKDLGNGSFEYQKCSLCVPYFVSACSFLRCWRTRYWRVRSTSRLVTRWCLLHSSLKTLRRHRRPLLKLLSLYLPSNRTLRTRIFAN